MTSLTRRQVLAGGIGIAASVATGGALTQAWALLAREDLIPGEVPTCSWCRHGGG